MSPISLKEVANGNHYKFTGKERDAESGLDNFGARYHASTMGRFMTLDWAAVTPETTPALFRDLARAETLRQGLLVLIEGILAHWE